MEFTRYHMVLALTAGILITVPLNANTILPGGTVSPEIFTDPGSVPLLNQTTGTYNFGSGIGLITGTYTEIVAVDPFGVTCSGCLDFAYQVSLDPGLSSGISNLAMGQYFGYSTNVGFISESGHTGGSGGSGAPISVQRGPFGGGIFFNFASRNAGAPIGPGGSSAFLIVATDAKTYDTLGHLQISGGRDGSPAHGQIDGLFEPTFQASAPEASTAVLLGLGVAAIVGFSRKRRENRSTHLHRQ